MAIISGGGSGPDPKVRENLEKLVVSSEKTSRISLMVSIVAICVASISVYFAYQDSEDDTKWKNSQLELLKEISEKIGKSKDIENKLDTKK